MTNTAHVIGRFAAAATSGGGEHFCVWWRKGLWFGVSADLRQLRLILLAASFLGLLATSPLWLSSRTVPLLPIASWFPHVAPPWDKAMFVLLVLCLGVACRYYRPAILCHLVLMLLLYFADANRGQPWVYLYGVMLLLTLLPETVALAGCRLALSATYIWAGIQKCNPSFFRIIPPFFTKPALDWGMPVELVSGLQVLMAGAPIVEVLIGLGIWSRSLRCVSVGGAVLVHGAALLFLGPAGLNYNSSVWPWNVAMLALVVTLSRNASLRKAFAQLRCSSLAIAIVSLVSLLPVLSFFGKWDSYFSFSLYSANLATADIYVTQAFRDRLPPELRRHVHAVRQAYDPAWQGPFVVDFQSWGMAELGAPTIPEPRNFHVLFQYLRSYSTDDADLRMIVAARGGTVTFHQGAMEHTLAFRSQSTEH